MERLDAIPSRPASSVATVKQAGDALLESFFRLVKLLDQPRDVSALAPLLGQEILYRLADWSGRRSSNSHSAQRKFKQPCCACDRLDSEEHESAVTDARACPVRWHESIVFTRGLQDRNSTLSDSIPRASTAAGGTTNVGHRGNRYRRSGISRGLSKPSQFRMDYRRFFGETPSKDLDAIRLLGRCGNPSLYVSG
jgi:hypothetical protein